jgi:phosphate transport system protein
MPQDAAAKQRHFADELSELKHRLLAMGGLAEERVRQSVRGLVERTPSILADVIAGDDALNKFHVEIDDRCFKLLALHQPVAGDLRTIVAVVKINSDLERVGDLAVNIAEAGQRYLTHPPVKRLVDIPRMATHAQAMLHDALDAFVSGDTEQARQVLDRDDVLDDLKSQVFRELLTYMLGDPHDRPGIVRSSSAPPRAHRRHATNLAEDVIIVTAKDVRHHSRQFAVNRLTVGG